MDARIARKAAHIIDDSGDLVAAAVVLEIGQHRHHTGALGERSGDSFIKERLYDRIAFALGIFAAAHGLGFEGGAAPHSTSIASRIEAPKGRDRPARAGSVHESLTRNGVRGTLNTCFPVNLPRVIEPCSISI